jgi:hypothetical protein
MPANHHVVVDLVQQALQGVGKRFGVNGRSQWFPMQEEREQNNFRRTTTNPFAKTDVKWRMIKYFNTKKPESYFEIEEGLIGITDMGYYAAISKPRVTDPYVIFIFGNRRQGKSLLKNRIEDINHNTWRNYGIEANDLNGETKTNCLPWYDCEFLRELERFGEITKPRPCVYLHPILNRPYPKIHYQEVGFDSPLSLKKILSDPNLITYNSQWSMSGTSTLLEWKKLVSHRGRLRTDGLAYINSLEEGMSLFRNLSEGMKQKAERVLYDIFNSHITDKSSGIPSQWMMRMNEKEYAAPPHIICMAAGLFPIIYTKEISKEKVWFPIYEKTIMKDVMDFSSKQDKTCMIFIDEVDRLLKNPETRDVIEETIRECGKEHVGVCMVNHNFEYVQRGIYTHSTGSSSYKFVFNTAEKALINQLKKEGLSAERAKEIPKLKQFECFAFGDFVLYDSDGKSFSNNGQPIKICRIIPPNCQHYGG